MKAKTMPQGKLGKTGRAKTPAWKKVVLIVIIAVAGLAFVLQAGSYYATTHKQTGDERMAEIAHNKGYKDAAEMMRYGGPRAPRKADLGKQTSPRPMGRHTAKK